MRCYLFDIDGTLADCSHRLPHIQKTPKDWDAFFAACWQDKPIIHIIDLMKAVQNEEAIVVVSGRSDVCRADTVEWLRRYTNLDWNEGAPPDVYMRCAGDHRPDHIVKSELLDQILADGWRPIMVFEDRTRCVEMFRARGIPCAQIAPGDF
jgi:hypothetical protein